MIAGVGLATWKKTHLQGNQDEIGSHQKSDGVMVSFAVVTLNSWILRPTFPAQLVSSLVTSSAGYLPGCYFSSLLPSTFVNAGLLTLIGIHPLPCSYEKNCWQLFWKKTICTKPPSLTVISLRIFAPSLSFYLVRYMELWNN